MVGSGKLYRPFLFENMTKINKYTKNIDKK